MIVSGLDTRDGPGEDAHVLAVVDRFELTNAVKMVIWDLDETFWRGTLTEGGIDLVPANIEILKELASRGIVSSICSKNEHEAVRSILEAHDLWGYFVFPAISFESKGAAVASIIRAANLRPDNVLFIDDNRLNLNEALAHAPHLMIAEPEAILSDLLLRPQTTGASDPGLVKLRQYQQIQFKRETEEREGLGTEDFLRRSDISIEIDIDVERYLPRVVDLINKSNQLNFTKKRLPDTASVTALQEKLGYQGVHAGVVKARDRYSDYGVIGFFMATRSAGHWSLEHFVFSCRIMNMGIEQYVFELLKQPACDIVAPVAHGLRPFTRVDWIRIETVSATDLAETPDIKLLFLGGCDLLQVATYCGARRSEYVNSLHGDKPVRYDDFGFLLNPRALMARSPALKEFCAWKAETADLFDADLAEADVVVLSLLPATFRPQFILQGDLLARRFNVDVARVEAMSVDSHETPLAVRLEPDQKARMLKLTIARVARLSGKAKVRILLGVVVRGGGLGEKRARDFNATIRSLCAESGTFTFLDIEPLVADEDLLPENHLTRRAAFEIAKAVNALVAQAPTPAIGPTGDDDSEDADWRDLIAELRAQASRSRTHPL